MSRSINLYDETTPLLQAAPNTVGMTAITVSKASPIPYAVICKILQFLLVNNRQDKNVHIQSQKNDIACKELIEGRQSDGNVKRTLLISLDGFRLLNKRWTEIFDQHFSAPFFLASAYAKLLVHHRGMNKFVDKDEYSFADMPVMLREAQSDYAKYSPVLLAGVGQLDTIIPKNATFKQCTQLLAHELTTVGSSLLKTILPTNEERMSEFLVIHQTRLSGFQKLVDLQKTRWKRHVLMAVIASLSVGGGMLCFVSLLGCDPSSFSCRAFFLSAGMILVVPIMLICIWNGCFDHPVEQQRVKDNLYVDSGDSSLIQNAIDIPKKMPVVNASHLHTTQVFAQTIEKMKPKFDWEKGATATALTISDENKPSAEAEAPTL